MNELENYKNKYNNLRKQLNYITQLKYNDKENINNNNQIIIEYQRIINELYLNNENLLKENTYLKLISQNIFLERNNIGNNQNKNIILLEEDNELLKKDKLNLYNIIKRIQYNQQNEINNEKYLINKEMKDLKLKNNLLLNKLNLIKNKNNKIKCFFSDLTIENTCSVLLIKNNINEYNNNKKENDKSEDCMTNFKNKENNYEFLNTNKENFDLLMQLYNKSKQLEKFINNSSSDYHNI